MMEPTHCTEQHPGQSCMRTKSWHLRFSRMLTTDEWSRLGRLLDLDPKTFDSELREFDALACGDLVHAVAPDVTMDYRELQ